MLPERHLVIAEHRGQLERFRRHQLRTTPCLFGWEFLTLHSLVQALAEQLLGKAALLSSIEGRDLLGRALDRAVAVQDASQRTAWATAGCRDEVSAIIHEVRLRGRSAGTAAPPGAQADGNLSLVVEAWRTYETLLNGRLDQAAAWRLVVERVRALHETDPAAWPLSLRGVEAIHVVGFRDPEPWQTEMIEALEAAFGPARVARQGALSRQALLTADALGVMMGTGNAAVDGDTLRNQLSGIEFVQAADVEVELLWLARRLRATLAGASRLGNPSGSPVSPEEILLVTPADPAYRQRLATLLDEHGIPHDGAHDLPLSETPFGEFVLRLPRLAAPECAWDDILWLLSSPFVVRSGLWQDADGLSLRTVARLLRRFRLRRGAWDDWVQALARLRDRTAAAAAAPGDPDDSDSAARERLAEQLRRIDRLQGAFTALMARLQALFSGPERRSPADWAAWLRAALGKGNLDVSRRTGVRRGMEARAGHSVEDEPPETPPARGPGAAPRLTARTLDTESAAISQTLEILLELPDNGRSTLTATEFSESLRRLLGAQTIRSAGVWTDCVSIRTPEQVEAADWSQVFAVGMAAGALPAETADIGILRDGDREQLGLRTTRASNRRAAEALGRALGAAAADRGRLIMSYAVTGMDRRAVLPSPFLQRLDDALACWEEGGTGWRRLSHFLPDAAGDHAFRKLEPLSALPDADAATTADEAALALALARPEGVPAGDPLRRWQDIRNWNPEPGATSSLACFGPIATDAGLSPSQLDQFGCCPYRYFAQCVLGLSRSRDPSPVPDALEVGSALHGALDQAVRAVLDDPDRGSAFFVCRDEAEQRQRIAAFLSGTQGAAATTAAGFDAALDAAFASLDASGVSLQAEATTRLRQRWRETVEREVLPRLFPVDQLPDLERGLGEQVSALRRDVQAGSNPVATALLESWLAAMQTAEALPRPAAYPRGWKQRFDGLAGAYDRLRKAKPAFAPVCCEWEFARRDQPLAIALGGGTEVRLRGRVDRVDVAAGASPPRVRICDYKTSRKLNRKADLRNGIDLQLPAYALAFDELRRLGRLPAAIPPGAELDSVALVPLRGGKERLATVADDNLLELARTHLARAQHCIGNGLLAPDPRGNCPVRLSGSCDYPALCRVGTIPEPWFGPRPEPADGHVPAGEAAGGPGHV